MAKRKIGVIIGVVCLLALAGAFAVKWRFETQIRNDIEKLLASLPPSISAKAEKIDVSFFEKSATVANLKVAGNIPVRQNGKEESVPVTFSIGRIAAAGINVDACKEGSGTVKIADSVTMLNTVVAVPDKLNASIESYVLEDISGDYNLIFSTTIRAFSKMMEVTAAANYPRHDEDVRQYMDAVAAMLQSCETVHIGRTSLKNYTYSVDVDGETVAMRLESAESRDYSIRTMGPFAMRGFKASYNGAPLLEMEELGADGLRLPSLVALCEMLAKNPFPEPGMVQAAFKGQEFALNNLRVKNMVMRDPLVRDRPLFSLADTNFSYVAETAHTMDFSFNTLHVDKRLVFWRSGVSEAALASLPETIAFDGAFQAVSTPKKDNIFDVACKKLFLKGTGMGEGVLSFTVEDVDLTLMAMGAPSGALKFIDFAATDRGLSDLVFFAADDAEAGISRSSMVEHARALGNARQNQADKDMLNGLATFLEKAGGTLQIALRPQQPSTMDQLIQAYMMDPAALGLTVTATPGP